MEIEIARNYVREIIACEFRTENIDIEKTTDYVWSKIMANIHLANDNWKVSEEIALTVLDFFSSYEPIFLKQS